MILESIHSPADVKALEKDQLPQLCEELRSFLIESVSQTGGHLASNLGAVELTVAIHRGFDTYADRLVFDVGHQCYVHKALTGRQELFSTLRQFGGLSGFPKPYESEHDAFIAGHASNSVSVALGMARARTLQHKDYHVLALIGDGALTGGLAYEGLNDAGDSHEHMIVILNDNGMSMNPNVGAMPGHLRRLRSKPAYYHFKKWYRGLFGKHPEQNRIYRFNHKLKTSLKKTLWPGSTFFENMGFTYLGPIDGHDLPRLCVVLQWAKELNSPVLSGFAKEFPERFFDVAIAEGHGVSMSAGLASQGMIPVFAVYSTFLQRGYDELIHDVSLEHLHVVLAVDRAGLVGADGETHHGCFDVLFLSEIPGFTVLCPSSFGELRSMLRQALFYLDGPVAVRYPRGGEGAFRADTSDKPTVCLRQGADVTLVSYGILVNHVLEAAELLAGQGIQAEVVKLNRVSPLDDETVCAALGGRNRLLVLEDSFGAECVGQRLAAILAEHGQAPEKLLLKNLGKTYAPEGSVGQLEHSRGLDAVGVAAAVREAMDSGE